MRLRIDVESLDVETVRRLIAKQKGHDIVQARLSPQPQKPGRARLWRAQVMCLLTTQNKSGKGSPVDDFLNQRPFPLSLQLCQLQAEQAETYIYSTLETAVRRFRRWKVISRLAALNFHKLENGGWAELEHWVDKLLEQQESKPSDSPFILERQAAIHLQEHYKGFGPKQSRNFWQSLGLTRYEIPIDSRVLRWSRKKLNLRLPMSGLANEEFYELVADAYRELCERADVLPCVFDGAVFSLYEKSDSAPSATDIFEDDAE